MGNVDAEVGVSCSVVEACVVVDTSVPDTSSNTAVEALSVSEAVVLAAVMAVLYNADAVVLANAAGAFAAVDTCQLSTAVVVVANAAAARASVSRDVAVVIAFVNAARKEVVESPFDAVSDSVDNAVVDALCASTDAVAAILGVIAAAVNTSLPALSVAVRML
jgi:ABC-type amino acid transport substrate-binding protein